MLCIVKCCICSKGFWDSPADTDPLIVAFRDSLSVALLRTKTIRVENAGFRERVLRFGQLEGHRCEWMMNRLINSSEKKPRERHRGPCRAGLRH